ncbi:MAG: bifunctional folylpolyglutamate synthase/dihydrofolate synthase [Chloroflexia bacterium]|nr:bifunctional folylpolyglutamate synthase/dihydrofolate synthase [Chloroflexia bacterium]
METASPKQPTYRDALAAIWARSGYDSGFISNPFAGDDAAKLGLVRTRRLLDRLGAPDQRFGIVHVAGSKGKGSTCAFIERILRAADYRVGRYTSPHLHRFRDRFAIDGEAIDEADFARHLAATVGAAECIERDEPELGEITAFELTTAMAFAVFAAHDRELAVIEVGMGGALDATNVVTPLVSAIAPLDYEHTAVLGSTMAEIARNKAGIIKPGRPVAVAAQEPEAIAVIEARARAVGSPILLGGRDWHVAGAWDRFTATGPWGRIAGLRSGLIGPHQTENAGLALATCFLLEQSNVRVPEQAIRRGIAATVWPGRFEEVTLPSEQRVIIDGAHTPASARALTAALRSRYPGKRAAFVVGLLRDKDPLAFVAALAPVAAQWFLTAPESPRALPGSDLTSALAALTPTPTTVDSTAGALAAAVAGMAPLIVVTGSLTMAAEARVALGLATNDPKP